MGWLLFLLTGAGLFFALRALLKYRDNLKEARAQHDRLLEKAKKIEAAGLGFKNQAELLSKRVNELSRFEPIVDLSAAMDELQQQKLVLAGGDYRSRSTARC